MYSGIACILVSSFLLADSGKSIDIHNRNLPNFFSLSALQLFLQEQFFSCDFSQKHLNVDKLKMVVYDFSKGGKKVMLPLSQTANYILNHLDLKRKWVIYIPGFNTDVTVNEGGSAEMLKAMRRLHGIYYMVVNHAAYTYVGNKGYVASYLRSVKYMYSISGAIADFLAKITRGISVARIRLIGHSLGGQISGAVGFIFRKMTRRPLERISALDPAGPCFRRMEMSAAADQAHIRSGAAKRVEVFHCNAGALGTIGSYTDAEYFYNYYGIYQPLCTQTLITERCHCSHSMCPVIYAASVKNGSWYPAVERNDANGTVYSGFVGSDDEGIFRVMTHKYSIDP